jgi:hypothetical protein
MTCLERGKNIIIRKGGGINIALRPNTDPCRSVKAVISSCCLIMSAFIHTEYSI